MPDVPSGAPGSGARGIGVPLGSATFGGGGPGNGPAFVPINKMLPPAPIASTDGPGSGLRGNPSGGGGPNPPGVTPNNGSGGTGQNPAGGAIDPNGSGRGPSAGTSNAGGPNPGNGPAGQGKVNGVPGTPNANGQPGQGGGQTPAGHGENGDTVGLPTTTFGNTDKTPKKVPAGPVLSRVLGNKDFLITIECYSDFVTISPGGMSFRWTAANMKTADQAFAQAIANLIEHRQASVRAGEPPYRPLICFRVTADGRPMCLHAYPLLEPLHVPMTRENVVE